MPTKRELQRKLNDLRHECDKAYSELNATRKMIAFRSDEVPEDCVVNARRVLKAIDRTFVFCSKNRRYMNIDTTLYFLLQLKDMIVGEITDG